MNGTTAADPSTRENFISIQDVPKLVVQTLGVLTQKMQYMFKFTDIQT